MKLEQWMGSTRGPRVQNRRLADFPEGNCLAGRQTEHASRVCSPHGKFLNSLFRNPPYLPLEHTQNSLISAAYGTAVIFNF